MRGFIRKIDKLGRICLPMEFRLREKLCTDDKVEMVVTDDGLLMRKYEGDDELAVAMGRLKRAIIEDDRIYEKLKDTYLKRLDLLEAEVFGAAGVDVGEDDDSYEAAQKAVTDARNA